VRGRFHAWRFRVEPVPGGVRAGGGEGARVVLGGRREGAADLRPYAAQGSAASAAARAEDLAHVCEEIRAAGTVTLRAMAEGFNARGIAAPRGGRWSAAQVARVEARMRGG